ncbi:hypothetical protein Taro_031881 [Colocasia esculenta]|uniref:Aminotransferase-like plant mobile domain-containing protein n=1 Tax=Colocasia esculenta TaxID=4460 RepID=A0A843VR66_COLES|nr:hypothetical protein [Colocasia esculenta]
MRMLEDIISTYVGGNIFLLGKKEVLFTVEDVGIILGMPSFGHPVRHYGSSKKKSRLHKRFGVATNFDRKKVHSLIQQLVNLDEEADVEDTIRLWIVLLLCTFLCPRSVHSCPQQMLSYLDDIQRIREYNWAAAVQEAIKNLTVERNEWETIYEGNQIVPEDTSTVPPVAASFSLLQEIAASIKCQEVKFDQLTTHLNDQKRQIEEIMRNIHKRDEPVTHEEGAAGPTPTFSEHVDVQPPMMHDVPVTQQEWAAWPPTFSQYVADVQPPMMNDDQAPPIGHFEEVPTTTIEEVDAQNPNSMVQAIKEHEDRRPGVYDQSPYVRVKNPVTMSEKEKAVAKTVRRMLTEYGAFPDAANLAPLSPVASPPSPPRFPANLVQQTCSGSVGAFGDRASALLLSGGWRGRVQDMVRIPGILTFKNDAYEIPIHREDIDRIIDMHEILGQKMINIDVHVSGSEEISIWRAIFWQNGEPKLVSHFTSTDEMYERSWLLHCKN